MPRREKKKKRVSLKEIAEQAGVTQGTASRILNKVTTHKYAESTVERVIKIAREKGYQSNQFYRSAFTGKTRSAGVIATAGGSFHGPILQAIHDRLLEDDYATVIGFTQQVAYDQTAIQEKKIMARLHGHRVDGFILCPFMDHPTDAYFRDILDAGLPLIAFDRNVNSELVDFVGSDCIKGGRLAAAHFAELGHKRIAQVFRTTASSAPIRERASGFERELFERGHVPQTINYETYPELRQKLMILFSQPDPPTAVFCGHDVVATHVYRHFRELGLSVPDDVSVIGFGKLSIGSYIHPQLTTIDQKPYEIGTAAAELFLKRANESGDEREGRREIRVDVELVERGSCRAL